MDSPRLKGLGMDPEINASTVPYLVEDRAQRTGNKSL